MTAHLRLGFYGDDFTGSTDAMEVLSRSGWRTVLFLSPPSASELREKFADLDCLGIAGISRSLKPEHMQAEVHPPLQAMLELGCKVIHYKVCSTLDSSPTVGSIGKVLELTGELFSEQQAVPILIAAPALKRFTVFGTHFASYGDRVYRLDRHPVMSNHPVTPMKEADISLHLAEQTEMPIATISCTELEQDRATVQQLYANKLEQGARAIVFDALEEKHLHTVGHLMWEETAQHPLFVVGSSGVEHALELTWKQGQGHEARNGPVEWASPGAVDALLVLSGSCSATTRKQMDRAVQEGFHKLKLLPERISKLLTFPESMNTLADEIGEILDSGVPGIIVVTAEGPDDQGITQLKAGLGSSGSNATDTGELLGCMLGRLAKLMVIRRGLRRIVFAGGDTSGYATKELGIKALEMLYPSAPGAPLCCCHSDDPVFHKLELALKGGQLGQEDYFMRVRKGI